MSRMPNSLKLELDKILENLGNVFESLDPEVFHDFARRIKDAPHIFLAGMGRSGHIARCFAVRLTQLGKSSYVVFEATSPAVRRGDLLMICSGSGQTSTMVTIAKKAKSSGATLAVVTGSMASELAQMADIRLFLPGLTPPTGGERKSILQPLQTLFEQALLLTLDALTLHLMRLMDVDEESMRQRHSDLE
jgi:6-phospho-3-hexuloisomerase